MYTAGSALGIVGSVVRVGMAARLLPADVAGAWLGLQLVLAYGANLHLGAVFGMFRSVPMLRAGGELERAAEVERSTFTFMLATSTLGSLAFWSARWVLDASAATPYLAECAVLLFVNVMKSYFVARVKADSEFKALSVSSALGSVVSVATLALILAAGLHGLVVGMIAQAVVETLYLVRHTGLPRLGLRPAVLGEQLSVGLLTLLVTSGTTLLTSIDRTVMLQRLGAETTGLYYLGANIVTLVPVVFGLPAAVLTPRFFEQFGRTKRAGDLMRLVEEPLHVTGVLVAVVLGGGALALPAAVAHFWPKLVSANLACHFALLATAPLVLSGMVTNVFYALNRQVAQLLLLGVGVCATYALTLAAAHFAPGLTSIAGAACAGLFVFYVATTIGSYRLMGASPTAALGAVGRSLVPTLAAGILVAIVEALASHVWPSASIVRAVVSEVVLLVAFAPWLLGAVHRLRRR